MAHIAWTVLACGIGLCCGLAVITFLKAFTAKMVTGKWPHEDPKSEAVFRILP